VSPPARRPAAAPAATKITAAALRGWPLPDLDDSGGKEDRGRVLVLGGSRELGGAVRLAGTAALRAGAGKLQVATVTELAPMLGLLLPEARVVGLRTDARGGLADAGAQALELAARADAVLVGPGMEAGAATRRVARKLLDASDSTVVLDAGALDMSLVRAAGKRPGGAVLTPHVGEMAALVDLDEDAIAAAPAATARAFAREWGVVLALKGRTTWIAAPDGRLWVNTGGSVGLGTSGSGDVLAGLIAGLAARGAAPAQAAVWGVYLHAQAGARLARRLGRLGFLAREIAGEVPALLPR
jgi:ADP-dependent NAD(P)H-hydrate dehydratase